jgi:hypothetical protein
MHVNAKKTAVSGLLMALSVLLLVLSGVLDFSTLFFLAAAAFFVGIIIKEYGLGYGAAFFTGCTILGFLLAPEIILHYLCHDGNLCAGCGSALAVFGETSYLESQENDFYGREIRDF